MSRSALVSNEFVLGSKLSSTSSGAGFWGTVAVLLPSQFIISLSSHSVSCGITVSSLFPQETECDESNISHQTVGVLALCLLWEPLLLDYIFPHHRDLCAWLQGHVHLCLHPRVQTKRGTPMKVSSTSFTSWFTGLHLLSNDKERVENAAYKPHPRHTPSHC